MKTRHFSRAAMMMMLLMLLTTTAWAQFSGSGTSGSPYLIANASDLQ